MHPEVVAETIAGIEAIGGSVTSNARNDLLFVNHEVTLAFVIARCQSTAAGSLRWKVRLDTSLQPDLTVVVRLDPDNKTVKDYYLLPWLDIGHKPRLGMAENNGINLDSFRTDDLSPLFHLLRRHTLEGPL